MCRNARSTTQGGDPLGYRGPLKNYLSLSGVALGLEPRGAGGILLAGHGTGRKTVLLTVELGVILGELLKLLEVLELSGVDIGEITGEGVAMTRGG